MPGEVIAERHALTADLGWQGFLCRDGPGIAPLDSDQVLLWQGERPLIFHRTAGAVRTLVVNFDCSVQTPIGYRPFVVLLHRSSTPFAPGSRAGAVECGNNQPLQVASDPAGPALKWCRRIPREYCAQPEAPGFFRVTQGEKTLLAGAAHFADPREADFRQAVSFDGLQPAITRLVEQGSQGDFLTPAWALLLGGVMLMNWAFVGRSRGGNAERC
jgi:hypothetical protein